MSGPRRETGRRHGGSRPGGRRRGGAPRPSGDRIPVLIATQNRYKARELGELVAELPVRVLGPEVVAQLEAPVEDGATFEANAVKKALHYSRLADCLVIADDSGLEIDALGGEPGVRSARLGGRQATDADRVRLILGRLEGVPWDRRTARFRCAAAIARRGHLLATFEGQVEGRIAFEPEGSSGFGYDPIFFYEPAGQTFASLSPEEKNRVSHRGAALRQAAAWLRDWVRRRPPA